MADAVASSARSMSTYASAVKLEPGGSIDLESYVALNASLGDIERITLHTIAAHNSQLADLFRHSIMSMHSAKILGQDSQSGMVTVCFRDAARVQFILSRVHKIETSYLHAVGGVRFCFHYYHEENDVYQLVEALESILSREFIDT